MFCCCVAEDQGPVAEVNVTPIIQGDVQPVTQSKVEVTAETKAGVEEATAATVAVPVPEFGTFTVELPMDGNLGLVLDVVDSTRGPMISKVDHGAIQRFNEKNPSQA
ncbi:unnamed protein product, partial [Cladocopium goreaui]